MGDYTRRPDEEPPDEGVSGREPPGAGIPTGEPPAQPQPTPVEGPGPTPGWIPGGSAGIPSGRRSRALVGCLLALVLVPALAISAIIALIFLGAQVSSMLSTTGQPASSAEATSPLLALPMQHDAPDLEARLPSSVGGRDLSIWSVSGRHYFEIGGPISDEDLAAIEAELATQGLRLDDIAQAVAGRSDVEHDPPYFVFAIRWGDLAASDLPAGLVIENPDAGIWRADTVGGKSVRVGTAEMFGQGEHVRGIPYLYDSGNLRFVVVTDDLAWAADALRQLP